MIFSIKVPRVDASNLSGIAQQLETDSKILLDKASMALKKYKMHSVVANELSTRKEEVTVVTSNGNISVHRDKTRSGSDVEDPLVEHLVDRHSTYIKDSHDLQVTGDA